MLCLLLLSLLFFFNDTATTEIYTLSLHDALPISCAGNAPRGEHFVLVAGPRPRRGDPRARPRQPFGPAGGSRSEEHTSELQSPCNLVCRLLLEKKNFRARTCSIAVSRRLFRI